LDVVDRHFPDRAVQERLDVAPAPMERRILGLRLDWRDALVAVPQWMQVLCFKLRDERRPRRCAGSSLGHGVHLPLRQPHVFGSLASTLALSIRLCLMNTRGSILSPLR